MARTVGDIHELFQVMCGPDPGDPLSAPVPLRSYSEKNLRGLRIGILESKALGQATPETHAAVKRAAQLLSEQGFVVEPFRLSSLDRALELWWVFFGSVIGHLISHSIEDHESLVSPMLHEYLSIANASGTLNLDQFTKACADRDHLRTDLLRQMQDVPILLSPVSSGPAFRHGEGNYSPGTGYLNTMCYSQWLNLAGFPGASVPIGHSPVSDSKDVLPIGVQIIGRPFEDELVLAVAEILESARGPWQAPPMNFV